MRWLEIDEIIALTFCLADVIKAYEGMTAPFCTYLFKHCQSIELQTRGTSLSNVRGHRSLVVPRYCCVEKRNYFEC